MEANYSNIGQGFEQILALHQDWLFTAIRRILDRIESSPGSRVGPPMGNLGQVPANVRLSDCCAYTRRNGLNHLGSFARAMDTPAMRDIVLAMLSHQRVIFVDLGSGASLTWILTALVAATCGETKSLTVVNVDHAKNMHRVAREIENDLSSFLDANAVACDRRQVIQPSAINGFTSSELEDKPAVFLVLNHLLHQNQSTHLPVPEFVTAALEACRAIARSAGGAEVGGISLEPWGLSSGFGQRGLAAEVALLGGTTTTPVKVAGDSAGKSVVGFSFS